ncbi:MAG: hypothetical protein KatS3mg104_1946 [Phycisphaerae bacterium]|jgi:hypothetical protein|nr:MAG: hypothetical protein KatS3mg104_1946 [Phycisphaerae bacterium]
MRNALYASVIGSLGISFLTASVPSAGAATILSDTFGSSTLNAASPAAPTGTSTNYAVLSSGNATASSIASGALKLSNTNTSSRFVEMQALFSSSPISLASSGDYVKLTLNFTTNGMINIGSGTFNLGLYNSGGNGPVTGGALTNSGLSTATPSSYATGNAAGWLGYVARTQASTGNNVIYERPDQSTDPAVTSEAQDLLFANAGSGAFNIVGSNITSSATGTGVTMTVSTPYTAILTITNNAGNLDISYQLNSGTTNLVTLSGSDTTPLTLSYDGLAFGFRANNNGITGTPHELTVSSLTVESNIPEPASLSLLGLGIAGLLVRKRIR